MYDIAYVYEFTLNPDITYIDGFLLVINRGTTPIALSTATVVTARVDSNAVLDFAQTTASDYILSPGRSAGQLSPDAMTELVTSGLVTELNDDSKFDFTMAFISLPPSGVVHGQAVLEIGGAKLELPFTFNEDAAVDPSLDAAQRPSARATP